MLPRSRIVRRHERGTYHCTSRCVRRAHLCGLDGHTGLDFSHRRRWIEHRLHELVRVFAIEVDAWTVMENHMHLLLTRLPEVASRWTGREVVERWLAVFPPKHRGRVLEVTEERIEQELRRSKRVKRLRKRLADLGWFHRLLKQPLAELANREDGCTGRFWEGRYKCKRVLDVAHLLATSVYIDLNPIRAGLATTPEGSDHTSVQDRIHALQLSEKLAGRRRSAPRRARGLLRGSFRGSFQGSSPRSLRGSADPERDLWITPIADGPARRGLFKDLTLPDYLRIVDRMGRLVKRKGRGRIPGDLSPILERIGVDGGRLLEAVRSTAGQVGSAVGSARSCAREAVMRGTRRVVSSMRVSTEG